MKKHYYNILQKIKELLFLYYKPKSNYYLIPNISYFSQWESPELVDDILSNKIDARQDPLWKNSGALNPLEYLNWSWSICGIACLKMILESKGNIKYPLIKLAKNGLTHGFYSINKSAYQKEDYVNSISNLKYKPFVKFINENLPLSSIIINSSTLKEIIYYLEKKYFVIASVNAKIRDPKSNPPKKGGHLVLILGYDMKNKTLTFHNPSGIYRKSQEYTKISFSEFNKFFDNKGIIVNHI